MQVLLVRVNDGIHTPRIVHSIAANNSISWGIWSDEECRVLARTHFKHISNDNIICCNSALFYDIRALHGFSINQKMRGGILKKKCGKMKNAQNESAILPVFYVHVWYSSTNAILQRKRRKERLFNTKTWKWQKRWQRCEVNCLRYFIFLSKAQCTRKNTFDCIVHDGCRGKFFLSFHTVSASDIAVHGSTWVDCAYRSPWPHRFADDFFNISRATFLAIKGRLNEKNEMTHDWMNGWERCKKCKYTNTTISKQQHKMIFRLVFGIKIETWTTEELILDENILTLTEWMNHCHCCFNLNGIMRDTFDYCIIWTTIYMLTR